MSNAPWRDDPLGYMIGADAAKTFFDDTYEKKAIVIRHKGADRFASLLSIARIDELVSGNDFPGESVDMARSDPPVSRDQFIFPSGLADKGAISDLYRHGATLILPQLHQFDATLKDFTRSVETILSCHVQTNIYLTPPNSQGFRTHYDDHDVFVLQIAGEKTWRLYDTPIDTPYRGEGFESGVHEIGDPVEEFVLKAGEAAYVPRGLLHDASTAGDTDSLHITVGLIVKTWADLILEAVSEVALREPGFRNSLPPGFARPDFDRTESAAQFRKLIDAISREADLDGAYDLFIDNYIRSRMPDTSGTITGRGIPDDKTAKFRLRRAIPWRFAGDEESAVVITAGGELTFPVAAEPALNALLDGGTISRADLSALSDEDALQVIEKLFSYGVVEPC